MTAPIFNCKFALLIIRNLRFFGFPVTDYSLDAEIIPKG